ncbi:hypothetical protein BH11VER1_BH11VER1_11250 [soil metagenome]
MLSSLCLAEKSQGKSWKALMRKTRMQENELFLASYFPHLKKEH